MTIRTQAQADANRAAHEADRRYLEADHAAALDAGRRLVSEARDAGGMAGLLTAWRNAVAPLAIAQIVGKVDGVYAEMVALFPEGRPPWSSWSVDPANMAPAHGVYDGHKAAYGISAEKRNGSARDKMLYYGPGDISLREEIDAMHERGGVDEDGAAYSGVDNRHGAFTQIGFYASDTAISVVARALRAGVSELEAMLRLQAKWPTPPVASLRWIGMSATGWQLVNGQIVPLLPERYTPLSGADLKLVEWSYADLEGVDLHGADIRGSTLRGAKLDFASLRDADLRDADLTDSALMGVDFRGADLRGTKLGGAMLQQTLVDRHQLALLDDHQRDNAIVVEGGQQYPYRDNVARFSNYRTAWQSWLYCSRFNAA